MGAGNFRPFTESTPLNLTDHEKFGSGDYVGSPYGCAKFGANPSWGILGKWVRYNEHFYLFIYTLFRELTYRSDPSTNGFLRLIAHTTRTRTRVCLLRVSLILLPRTGISSRTVRSVIEYGLPIPFWRTRSGACYHWIGLVVITYRNILV